MYAESDLEGHSMIPFEAIITGETNDSRFEKFCRVLLQKSEGITLVSTSSSYDLGRDGVSVRRTRGTHAEVVCCTIDKDIESKVVRTQRDWRLQRFRSMSTIAAPCR